MQRAAAPGMLPGSSSKGIVLSCPKAAATAGSMAIVDHEVSIEFFARKSRAPSRAAWRMRWKALSINLEFWSIRIGCFLPLSFLDDPAWLAMMFC